MLGYRFSGREEAEQAVRNAGFEVDGINIVPTNPPGGYPTQSPDNGKLRDVAWIYLNGSVALPPDNHLLVQRQQRVLMERIPKELCLSI